LTPPVVVVGIGTRGGNFILGELCTGRSSENLCSSSSERAQEK